MLKKKEQPILTNFQNVSSWLIWAENFNFYLFILFGRLNYIDVCLSLNRFFFLVYFSFCTSYQVHFITFDFSLRKKRQTNRQTIYTLTIDFWFNVEMQKRNKNKHININWTHKKFSHIEWNEWWTNKCTTTKNERKEKNTEDKCWIALPKDTNIHFSINKFL